MYSFQIFDDSFITYRYSMNLVDGGGFVYNLGEKVQGITSPLWGMLLAVPYGLGFGIEWSSRILGLLAEVAVAWMIWRQMLAERLPLAGTVTLFLFAIDPYLAKTAVGGMESSLFLLGTVAASVLALRSRTSSAAVIAGLCYFLRPEALLFALALIAYLWFRDRRFPWRPCLIGAAIVVAGVGIEYVYYGTLIPQSVRGKFAFTRAFTRTVELVIFPKTDPIQALLTIGMVIGTAAGLETFGVGAPVWNLVAATGCGVDWDERLPVGVVLCARVLL